MKVKDIVFVEKEDIRIEVCPNESFWYRRGWDHENIKRGNDDDISTCRQIEEEIKRHVDNVGSIDILYNTVERCSFCLHEWEMDIDGPLCCGQADTWYRNGGWRIRGRNGDESSIK